MEPVASELLENRRLRATRRLDRKHRSALGQFFTPASISRFMASLLEFPEREPVHLLDPGAGIGSLTAAVVHRALPSAGSRLSVTCYEVEPTFQADLQATLDGLHYVTGIIRPQDFIEHTIRLLCSGEKPNYTHAILNPPYKKITTDSLPRFLVRKLGLETSNLYTCFIACSIASCRPGAQVVCIVPRSFMNGLYFKPFRHWLLERVALTHLHVFDSRDQAFSDDHVLQENVIFRMVVAGQQGPVTVSTSYDQTFANIRQRQCDFSELLTPGDGDLFIHVPPLDSCVSGGLQGQTLREIGLDVCTGPVVDFRLREHLSMQPKSGTVPLLYASHFSNHHLEWPKEGRKPNAIARNAETERWLLPRGCYVILRRLSSKEERRRIVAYLLDENALPDDRIGFENHLNVIHKDRHGLPADVARGLVAYLNSQAVDDYFRTFSGHTQVNATDLRRLKYPSIAELEQAGRATLA